MPREIDLTPRQRAILRAVFSKYADRVERVAVCGSRVQGRARPGSDIDLVTFGALSRSDVGALLSDLEESDLSVFADVTHYPAITHVPLREQIDQRMVPLFERSALLATLDAPAIAGPGDRAA